MQSQSRRKAQRAIAPGTPLPELIGRTEGEGKARLAAEGSAPHRKPSLPRQEESKEKTRTSAPCVANVGRCYAQYTGKNQPSGLRNGGGTGQPSPFEITRSPVSYHRPDI